MGLGGMKYAWQRQTKDFAHDQADKYSSLVLDNRGIGESDKPRMRYSTSEMAKDVIEVIDHIGWTGKRELHVIGISMGGMIAQELVRSHSFHYYFPSHLVPQISRYLLYITAFLFFLFPWRILHHPNHYHPHKKHSPFNLPQSPIP